MRMGMGLIRNRLGVYVVRRKVPAPLQEAVARVLNNGKTRQPWLQRTTGTKDKSEQSESRSISSPASISRSVRHKGYWETAPCSRRCHTLR